MKQKSLLIIAFAFAGLLLHAQDPLEKIQKVADKIIERAKFDFQLELNKPNEYFDFVEVLNFEQTFGNKAGTAYAYTEITSPIDQELTIQISHNDHLAVYLNNTTVYQKEGTQESKLIRGERALEFDFDFKVSLKKGKNTLLIKSVNDGSGKWEVYLQPAGALVFDERSKEKTPKIGLSSHPLVTEEVSKLSNWLMVGPFNNTNLNSDLGPEKGFVPGTMYANEGSYSTWTLPKINVFGNIMDRHPLWGGYLNYNYHTGGVAWGMMQLSEVTGNEKYDNYAKRYTDFHIDTKPFIQYQVYDLNGFRSANHQLFETPLLDFTLAPSLPYIYRLIKNNEFSNRKAYVDWVERINKYALEEQIRSPQGHYWRYTPEKYTTWTDDMFMGLPYLMLMSEYTDNEALKKQIYDDVTDQFFAFNEQTWHKNDALYQHAQYTENPVDMPYWTRANGWGIWAAVEILLRLPEEHKNYKKVLKHFQKHVDAVIKYQTESGFWYNVIDQPQSGDETSGTAIITLAIARGVNNGWLSEKYKTNAINAWIALETMIENDGTVHGICMGTMCSTDLDYYLNRPILDDDSHGILGLIFAAIEVHHLLNK